jgi:hypothetical protein
VKGKAGRSLAERARKVGGTTLRSIGHIARIQRLLDNDADYVTPQDMLAELADDNRRLTGFLRAAHGVCETYNDVASTSLLEVWLDETERRSWFLYESTRVALYAQHPASGAHNGKIGKNVPAPPPLGHAGPPPLTIRS